MKRELFGYVRGGYARILERFAEVLEDAGVEIQLGRCVRRIHRRDDGRIVVTCMDGETESSDPASFDKVVVTVAAPLAARICEGLSEEESTRLARVKYQGIVCASVLLREPLADFYVTNLLDRGLPFTGVIEMTTMVDRRYFGGNSLVYLPRYLSTDDPFFECNDEEVESSFLAGLERIYPSLHPQPGPGLPDLARSLRARLDDPGLLSQGPVDANLCAGPLHRQLGSDPERNSQRERNHPACRACRRRSRRRSLARSLD